MKAYDKLYINGRWVEGSGKEMTDVNPYTGEIIFTYKGADKSDVDAAYSAAKAAQKQWCKTTVAERTDLFEKLLGVMREYVPAIEECLMLEGGSTAPKRGYEAATCAQMVRYFMQFPSLMDGKLQASDAPGQLNCVVRKPRGVITVITPWNVPCLLTLKSVLPAIACGNAVVLKPSSDAPASALLLAEIFEKAGVPAGLLNVVAGGGAEIGDYLVSHPMSDLVAFTGSTEVGKHIASLAGARICDVSLELGGNNAMLILEDADIEAAAEKAVFGAYFHQGQICMGVNRIVAVGSAYDKFCECFAQKVKMLKAGDPKDPEVFIGPLINKTQVKKFEQAVSDTLASCATALVKGETNGNVISPWLLADVTRDMYSARNEVFGPVCSIMYAATEEDAVDIVNDTTYGLSNSVMSRDIFHAAEIASTLESGMVHINDQTIGEEFHVMFGGEKQSGLGRFNGRWVLEKFTTEQWISIVK